MPWHVILPFLRPVEHLLQDPDVTDIFVNGGGRIFYEKDGQMVHVHDITLTEKSVQVAVRNIARTLGDDISPDKPLLDARLPDGSRVAAVLAPCSVEGTVLAIRKFQGNRYSLDELVRIETLTTEVANLLSAAVQSRQNILISGGTGSGKTTLLNALAGVIDATDRVVVIEDTTEIYVNLKNIVRLEARCEQPSVPAVTIRDLVKTTLRLSPHRILLGEVRGAEAFDLLQALNTGHAGTIATLHANSAGQSLARFTTCLLMSGIDLPYRAIRSNIAEAVNLLVHIERRRGRRFVNQVYAVRGYDAGIDRYDLEQCYERTDRQYFD